MSKYESPSKRTTNNAEQHSLSGGKEYLPDEQTVIQSYQTPKGNLPLQYKPLTVNQSTAEAKNQTRNLQQTFSHRNAENGATLKPQSLPPRSNQKDSKIEQPQKTLQARKENVNPQLMSSVSPGTTKSVLSPDPKPIQQLQEQYQRVAYQNEELRNRLALLEVSLHNEVVTNEEQRAYIEVLKQTMGIKLRDSGLFGFLSSLKGNAEDNEVDLFVELNKLRNFTEQNTQDKLFAEQKYSETASKLEFALLENEELKQNFHDQARILGNTKSDFDKLLGTISEFEEEIKKLGQEKDSLLDYTEELTTNLEQTEQENQQKTSEIEELRVQFEQLTSERDGLIQKCEGSEVRLKTLMQDLVEVRDLSMTMEKQLKHLESENLKLAEEVTSVQGKYQEAFKTKEELERVNEQRKHEFEQIHDEHSQLVALYTEISQQMKNNNSSKHGLEERNKTLEKETKTLREQLQSIEKQKEHFEAQVISLQKKFRELEAFEAGVQEKEERIKSLLGQIDYLKTLVEDSKGRLERERISKSQEIGKLYEQCSELRSELRGMRDEKSSLEVRNTNLKEELSQYEAQLESRQKILLQKTRELTELQKVLEVSHDQARKFTEILQQKEIEADELKRELMNMQRVASELEIECGNIHKAREVLLQEQKKQRETVTKAREESLLKEEELTNEKEQKEKLLKQLEDVKKDLAELTKILEGGLTDEERRRYRLPQIILNGSDTFVFFHERVRAILLEKQKTRECLEEIATENEKLWNEKIKIEADNQSLYKNHISAQSEIATLNREVSTLNDRLKEYEEENGRSTKNLDRVKEEELTKAKEETTNTRERLSVLSEKYSRAETERQTMHFLVEKLREAVGNQDILSIVDNINHCHSEILTLQAERAALRSDCDAQEARLVKFAGSEGTKTEERQTDVVSIRRRIEDFKDALSAVESRLQINTGRKLALEKELNSLVSRERKKSNQYSNLEKANLQLKAELNMLTKENELIEHTKTHIETSFHELLRDSNRRTQRTPFEDRSNFTFPSCRESTDLSIKKRTTSRIENVNSSNHINDQNQNKAESTNTTPSHLGAY